MAASQVACYGWGIWLQKEGSGNAGCSFLEKERTSYPTSLVLNRIKSANSVQLVGMEGMFVNRSWAGSSVFDFLDALLMVLEIGE
jgi:hypothetical protein